MSKIRNFVNEIGTRPIVIQSTQSPIMADSKNSKKGKIKVPIHVIHIDLPINESYSVKGGNLMYLQKVSTQVSLRIPCAG